MFSQLLPLLVLATPLAAPSTHLRAQPDADATPIAETTTPVAIAPVIVMRDDADNGRIYRRHRLHIDTDAFAWRRVASWTDMDSESKRDSFNILGGAPAFGAGAGGPAGNVTFGYGYGVAKRLIVGARVGLGWQRLKDPNGEGHSSMVGYSVVPYLELVFRPGRNFRPYLGARVGLGGASATSSSDGDITTRVSTLGPTVGASVGFHAFVTERVSFDAALAFDYALAYGRSKVSGGPAESKSDFERISRLPNAALVVGISIWLGRDHTRMDRRDDDGV